MRLRSLAVLAAPLLLSCSDDPTGVSLPEVQRSTTTFDSFVDVGLDDLVIVVDDIANLDPPNWT
jgi:hypothetical protein